LKGLKFKPLPVDDVEESKTMRDFMDRVTLCHKYIKTMNLGTDNLIELKKGINNVVENKEKGHLY
jgi:hypothetical protein